MGFRFRKSITILPGLKINLSKGGVSMTAGTKGMSVTAGKRGIYGNVGLPGTGLSYRTRIDKPTKANNKTEITDTIVSIENNQLTIRDSNGNVLSERFVKDFFKNNSSQMRTFIEDECKRRNTLIEQQLVPSFSFQKNSKSTKPKKRIFESASSYIQRVSEWRSDQQNQLQNDVVNMLSQMDWSSNTNIECSFYSNNLNIVLKTNEIQTNESVLWRSVYTESIPKIEETLLSETEKNKRTIRKLVGMNILLFRSVFSLYENIEKISIETEIYRSNRNDKVIRVNAEKCEWKKYKDENDNEILFSALKPEFSLTTNYRLKLIN